MAGLIRRGKTYYLLYYVGEQQRRVSLGTGNLQIAKEKQRRFESDQAHGVASPLPTRTQLADLLDAYVAHLRASKTPKSVQTDIYYLRDLFGPICEGLRITSRKIGAKPKKRRAQVSRTGPRKDPVLEVPCLEAITTAMIATFISGREQTRHLAPKTLNRYREVLSTLINWAMSQRGVRMPERRNPAEDVHRYKEPDPTIRFLRLPEIAQQLTALQEYPVLQAAVALYVYAGLRREEGLWLTHDDVDLARGLIRVRAKTVNGEYWKPKTRGSNRVVPISSDLRRYLESYKPAGSDGPWYFPSPHGKRWDADNFSDDLRSRNRQAGLVWACLDFRHTFGSHLAQNGVSLHQIAKLMGNSPEICRRHYAALVPEDMHSVVEFRRLPEP